MAIAAAAGVGGQGGSRVHEVAVSGHSSRAAISISLMLILHGLPWARGLVIFC